MSFKGIVNEDQRLTILQALNEDANYSHNEHVIRKVLGSVGHRVSADYLRTQLGWLKEQDLIEVDIVGSDLWVAKLTVRGSDVATGSATAHGVRRPRPGE